MSDAADAACSEPAVPTLNPSIEDLFLPHKVSAASAIIPARSNPRSPGLSPRTSEPVDRPARLAPAGAVAGKGQQRVGDREAMAPYRRHEFKTGRACAELALDALGATKGVPIARKPVERAESGAPIWPLGVTGSITHSQGLVAAVAARSGPDLLAVGIDIEHVGRLSSNATQRVLSPIELEHYEQLTEPSRRAYAAAVFSAKEAFYKAQFQLTGRYLGFRAVTLRLSVDRDRLSPQNVDVYRKALDDEPRVEPGLHSNPGMWGCVDSDVWVISVTPGDGTADESLLRWCRGWVRVGRSTVLSVVAIAPINAWHGPGLG